MSSMRDCSQKRTQRNSFNKHLKRSLLVGVISTILIVLWLYYAGDSRRAPFEASVIPREEHQDMYLRSTGPREVIFIFSNRIDASLCYSVGSAYLSGFPVVVAGYEMPYKGPISKLDFMEAAIENTELEPEDVIVTLDSDTFFTGVDINPLLDRFIAQSAATPEKLDVLAVRQGRAMAPFLSSAEVYCWAANVFENLDTCTHGFQAVYGEIRNYAATHPEHKLALHFDLSPQRHINTGTIVARVWAYKEYLQEAKNIARMHNPPLDPKNEWDCDQAVATVLYLDLLKWEVEHDIFSLPLHERQAARSPYGIRPGFIGLDFINEFSVVSGLWHLFLFEMHDEHWAKYLQRDGPEHPHSYNVTDIRSSARFMNDLYERAYTARDESIFTRRALPRWVKGQRTSEEEDHITLTPPLYAVKMRTIDIVNNKTRRVFPAVFHASGVGSSYEKVHYLENGAISAQWFVPMAHSPKAKHQAMKYLASAPLFLSTNTSIIRDSYHAKCGFPFGMTIQKFEVSKTL